ncbi:MAG TPA: tetratricopeptide repeat protein [Candidatus Xenobia bacterium]|nr:tetratricopeptide repeat protein [Candidatus Xenobia bacterium]
MAKSRLEMLEEFVRERPTDAFAHYGLAMEYVNARRSEDALATFRKLIGFNPNYSAAYHQAGLLLSRLGRTEEAKEMFQRGIEVAGRNGEAHSKMEMEEALHDLSA